MHVVITARDLGKSVPSAWQERLKFALTTPLERWRPRPETAGVRAEWGWRTMDPAGVAARWGATLPPERVHVVTVPREARRIGRSDLWRRFAAACGLDAPRPELDFQRVNESLGLVAAELLRRVNERIREPITGNREQARWLRDTLAHGILAELGREPIGLTDEQFADAERPGRGGRRGGRGGRLRRAAATSADIAASRPAARTPGDATDAELLESALETIVRLLLLVRERTRELKAAAATGPADGPRVLAFGKGVVRRVTAPRVDRRHEDLRARIAELEARVGESRRLHLRVAELSDVVTELLLPPGQRARRSPAQHSTGIARAPVTPPTLRRADAVAVARRLAVGIGVADVRALEARVASVGEQLEENALLARPLEEQVRRLEAALVPVLEARARAAARS